MKRSLLAALAVTVVAAACGIPTDESANAIGPEQLPEILRPDATSTTTSAPPTPVTEEATIYLLETPPNTERTFVVPVSREVAVNAEPRAVLELLFGVAATQDEQELGYFNRLFEFDLGDVTITDGVATIDIIPLTPEGEPSEEPFTGELQGPAAQLVYSATELEGIDRVRILINSMPVTIPTSDVDAEPGAPLTRTRFERFDPETPDATPTTTSTSTTAP